MILFTGSKLLIVSQTKLSLYIDLFLNLFTSVCHLLVSTRWECSKSLFLLCWVFVFCLPYSISLYMNMGIYIYSHRQDCMPVSVLQNVCAFSFILLMLGSAVQIFHLFSPRICDFFIFFSLYLIMFFLPDSSCCCLANSFSCHLMNAGENNCSAKKQLYSQNIWVPLSLL